ncbi:MAG: hypothetical protein LBM95_08700 [Lactobacillales bacterium]|jgi:hypothetical protein|nr:hypothetical protein [Lactobacillales bacterium]
MKLERVVNSILLIGFGVISIGMGQIGQAEPLNKIEKTEESCRYFPVKTSETVSQESTEKSSEPKQLEMDALYTPIEEDSEQNRAEESIELLQHPFARPVDDALKWTYYAHELPTDGAEKVFLRNGNKPEMKFTIRRPNAQTKWKLYVYFNGPGFSDGSGLSLFWYAKDGSRRQLYQGYKVEIGNEQLWKKFVSADGLTYNISFEQAEGLVLISHKNIPDSPNKAFTHRPLVTFMASVVK